MWKGLWALHGGFIRWRAMSAWFVWTIMHIRHGSSWTCHVSHQNYLSWWTCISGSTNLSHRKNWVFISNPSGISPAFGIGYLTITKFSMNPFSSPAVVSFCEERRTSRSNKFPFAIYTVNFISERIHLTNHMPKRSTSILAQMPCKSDSRTSLQSSESCRFTYEMGLP